MTPITVEDYLWLAGRHKDDPQTQRVVEIALDRLAQRVVEGRK